ncbi:TetR/AcrR family transcriptional regulator [Nocardia sp. NPDC051900]|uniref:TetR/AcrR family transcriptional regulator n=1 Tax=Nocardia sp. NPDC051900 TaxID=3364326 RepID=UPI0037963FB6
MARPRRPLLTRDRIIDTALVDAEGLAAVSTRRLATELGVQGPTLYNHVRTKDDLIDAVVDAVLGEVDIAMFEGLSAEDRDWRSALRDWARSYRTAMAAHPHIVPALASGPGHRPNALRMADAVFGGLVAAGWPRREATVRVRCGCSGVFWHRARPGCSWSTVFLCCVRTSRCSRRCSTAGVNQQLARNLAFSTINSREKAVLTFTTHADKFPWVWSSQMADE